MAADEEIAGHEIAGIEVPNNPILPPTTDPADTCDAYAEIEFAGACVASGIIPIIPLFEPGESCDAYAEIEYAGECVSENAVFPSLPTSTVEDFDTSSGRLGCGVPAVFITTRCNTSMTCQIDLKDITKILWTRRLNEVSEAEVEIGLTGDSSQTCCVCLELVEPFCHELHIWRDGVEVWVGPIEAIRYERERVTIKARDVLGWLDVRIPENDVEFKTTNTGTTLVDNPLLETATVITSAGFTSLPTVPSVGFTTIIVVLDPDASSGEPEAVLVTTHVAASNQITVTRGVNGTKARYHQIGTNWAYGGLSGGVTDITYIAKYVLYDAFKEDIAAGFSCEYDGLFYKETGEEIEWFSEAFNQTNLEILTSLVETKVGLNFTTLGRTIVLTGDTLSLTPLILLNDEHIMGEIEVTKDGKQMVNRQYVHFEGDEGLPAIGATSVDQRYCYSLIERITTGDGLQEPISAGVMAQAIVNAAYIAPRIIEVPSGSRLSPHTPWTINEMVPGTKVNVAITRLCLSLTASFSLVGVSVEYSSSDGEQVGIELTPMNSTTEPF